MPVIDVDGHQVHFTDTGGAGSTIVIVPGGLGTTDTWLVVGKALAKQHRVIVVDLHGAGRTGPWTGDEPMTLDDEAALVTGVIAARCGEPVALMAHSYGAGVALRVATRKSALVRALVLVEPFVLELANQLGEHALYATARRGFDAFTAAHERGDATGAVRAWFEAYMPVPWASLPPQIHDKLVASADVIRAGNGALLSDPTTPAALAKLKLPALVLSGGDSLPFFREIATLLARQLPDARHAVIPGGTHLLYERRAPEIATAVTQFLAPASPPVTTKPRLVELRSELPLAVHELDAIAGDRLVGRTRDGAVPIRPLAPWFVRHEDPHLGASHVPALVRELVERGVTGIGFAGNDRIDDGALAALAPLAPTLEVLELAATAVTDAGLARLGPLPALRALDLGGTAITNGAAAWLRSLTALEHLRLGWTAISDSAIEQLALPRLRSLDLSGTRVGDRALAALARLPSLTTLVLAQTAVTDQGLAALAGCAFRHLDLSYTKVTDASLPHVARSERVVVRATAIARAAARPPSLVW